MAVFFTFSLFLTFLLYTVECATTIQIERVPHLNLDDGVEHAIRLTKGQSSIFYFHFPERKLPLFMHVTPCGAQVYWRLYAPNHQAYQPPNVHPNSYQFNDLLHVRIPPLVDFPHPVENDRMVLLGGQADERRMHYFNNAIDADFVMLNLSAVEDTTVRVFMTTSQTLLEKQYPPLPRNSVMEHDIYNDHDHFLLYNIRFRWQIPKIIQQMNDLSQTLNRYKYCILLTKTPLYTMCPGKNVINEAEHCVNQTTNEVVVKKLKSRGQLYATLFIRDAFSQSTSALRPIEIKLPIDPIDEEINLRKRLIRKEDEITVNQLHDGVVDEWVMPPIRHDIRNYDFVVPKSANPVHVQVVVRVCAGSVEIRIDKNGRRIKSFSHVSGSTRRFVILNNNDEVIRIQILNHRNKPSAFDIWASTHPELNPFPQLPDDANLHAQSGKCNSADLQFYRVPDVHVAYCLYMERVNFQSIMYTKSLNASEQCWPSRSPGELVTCFEEDRDADTERAKEELIHMTVPDLRPDTTYRFVLTVISMGKPYPRELKYKSQSVKTAAAC
uniref:NDNF_C domain-containing protein n=1 Tax=Panagrellus redivivus TaxID=6233 RepID=A0A7E4W6H3_PANRE